MNMSVTYVLETDKPRDVVEYFRKRFRDQAQAVRNRLASMDRNPKTTEKARAAARLELHIYEIELDVLDKLRIDPPSPESEIAKLPKVRAALEAASKA